MTPQSSRYRTIKSLAQYKSYESYLEKLLWLKEKSPEEVSETEQLSELIKQWDNEHGTKSSVLPEPVKSDQVKILTGLMKEKNINAGSLASTLNISQTGMSDILNYRKDMTPEIISKIAELFKVSPEVFG